MKITSVLSKAKFLGIFVVLSLALTAFYFLVTGIYVVSLGAFVETLEPLRFALTIIISLLSALAVTLMVYKQEQPLVCNANAPAFLGSVIALFTTGCPVCFPILLSALGVGGATALAISANAIPIQLASIALLTASIYYTAR